MPVRKRLVNSRCACRSTPGFIVNRVARPFYAEAWRALEEQVATPEVIDAALRDGGGFPMGPLALTDLIGQDVNFAVTCSVFNASGRTDVFCRRCCNRSWLLPGVCRRVGTVSTVGLLKQRRNWRWLRYQQRVVQRILSVTLSLNWTRCCCWKPPAKPRWP